MCDCNDCRQKKQHKTFIVDVDVRKNIPKNICKCRCKCKVPCKGPCRSPFNLPCRGKCRENVMEDRDVVRDARKDSKRDRRDSDCDPCKEKEPCEEPCKEPCKEPCRDPYKVVLCNEPCREQPCKCKECCKEPCKEPCREPCKEPCTEPCKDHCKEKCPSVDLLKFIWCQLEEARREKCDYVDNFSKQCRCGDEKQDCGGEICDEKKKCCDKRCFPWSLPVANDNTAIISEQHTIATINNHYIPINLFLKYVIKKISQLNISRCAKQNFIRAVMDIQVAPLDDTTNGASISPSDLYIAEMENILLSISAKWMLYADLDLAECSDVPADITRKLFFTDLSNNLPPPNQTPTLPDVVIITTENTATIKAFILTNLLC